MAECRELVERLTQVYAEKTSLEVKMKSSLDSIELCISEFADPSVPRYAAAIRNALYLTKSELPNFEDLVKEALLPQIWGHTSLSILVFVLLFGQTTCHHAPSYIPCC